MRKAPRRLLSPLVSRRTSSLLLALAFGLASAAAAAGASPVAPPPLAVSASPARITLFGRTAERIEVTNVGGVTLVVDAATASVAFDHRGRARIDPPVAPWRSARRWLSVSPRRLTLRPGRSAGVTVRSRPPRRAEPGDHHALVVLATRAVPRGPVAIRTRIGVLTLVRVPGRILRRLELRGLRVRAASAARVLELTVVNRGNVSERLSPGSVTVSLERAGRVLATLRATSRQVLPGMSATFEVWYAGSLRGRLRALVRLEPARAPLAGPGAPVLRPLRRAFSLRL